MSAYSRIRFGFLIVFLCLYITPFHYHHCANSSYFLGYSLHNIWGCLFSVDPFPLRWLSEYTRCLIITIIKSEVWTTIHCLGLGHGTMVCAVCLSIVSCCWKRPELSFQINQIAFWTSSPMHVPWWLFTLKKNHMPRKLQKLSRKM